MKAKKKPNTRIRTSCPDCGAALYLESRPELDEEIICDECESSLIVVRLNPLKLDWAYEDDNDSWDDDDDDDWDDDF